LPPPRPGRLVPSHCATFTPRHESRPEPRR
jgi:hypothetical protein